MTQLTSWIVLIVGFAIVGFLQLAIAEILLDICTAQRKRIFAIGGMLGVFAFSALFSPVVAMAMACAFGVGCGCRIRQGGLGFDAIVRIARWVNPMEA